MLDSINQPDATGESEQEWSDRRDAWERGHSAQRWPTDAPAADDADVQAALTTGASPPSP
jgi:hypothetical protein